MIRRPRTNAESRRRLDAHCADAAAHPLSPMEIDAWLRSLGSLDDAMGKAEQLAVCRDLLLHAPDDDMLGSDARIIKLAIEELERTLTHETSLDSTIRRVRRPRLGDRRLPLTKDGSNDGGNSEDDNSEGDDL